MILTNPIWGILHTISPSRINSYIRCGVKFQLEYIHRMRAPGSLNMHRGSGLHHAIEKDNKHFMIEESRLGYDVLKSIAMSCFGEKLQEGVFIPKRDLDKQTELISKAQNEMLQAVRLYADMEKPWIPDTVEEYVTQDIGYPLPVRIRIDLIDNNHYIYDWKTMDKNKRIISNVQDMIYSKYYEAMYGVRPSFKYVKFILTKKSPPRIEIDELKPIRNYDRLDNYIKSYFWGIENNVFLPASDTDFLCSESCCPFYLTCEFK